MSFQWKRPDLTSKSNAPRTSFAAPQFVKWHGPPQALQPVGQQQKQQSLPIEPPDPEQPIDWHDSATVDDAELEMAIEQEALFHEPPTPTPFAAKQLIPLKSLLPAQKYPENLNPPPDMRPAFDIDDSIQPEMPKFPEKEIDFRKLFVPPAKTQEFRNSLPTYRLFETVDGQGFEGTRLELLCKKLHLADNDQIVLFCITNTGESVTVRCDYQPSFLIRAPPGFTHGEAGQFHQHLTTCFEKHIDEVYGPANLEEMLTAAKKEKKKSKKNWTPQIQHGSWGWGSDNHQRSQEEEAERKETRKKIAMSKRRPALVRSRLVYKQPMDGYCANQKDPYIEVTCKNAGSMRYFVKQLKERKIRLAWSPENYKRGFKQQWIRQNFEVGDHWLPLDQFQKVADDVFDSYWDPETHGRQHEFVEDWQCELAGDDISVLDQFMVDTGMTNAQREAAADPNSEIKISDENKGIKCASWFFMHDFRSVHKDDRITRHTQFEFQLPSFTRIEPNNKRTDMGPFRWASWDIETVPGSSSIYAKPDARKVTDPCASISMIEHDHNQLKERKRYQFCLGITHSNEKDMLDDLFDYLLQIDGLIDYNGLMYDLLYVLCRAHRIGSKLAQLSPWFNGRHSDLGKQAYTELDKKSKAAAAAQANPGAGAQQQQDGKRNEAMAVDIPHMLHFDVFKVAKSAIKIDGYSLKNVTKHVLGVPKKEWEDQPEDFLDENDLDWRDQIREQMQSKINAALQQKENAAVQKYKAAQGEVNIVISTSGTPTTGASSSSTTVTSTPSGSTLRCSSGSASGPSKDDAVRIKPPAPIEPGQIVSAASALASSVLGASSVAGLRSGSEQKQDGTKAGCGVKEDTSTVSKGKEAKTEKDKISENEKIDMPYEMLRPTLLDKRTRHRLVEYNMRDVELLPKVVEAKKWMSQFIETLRLTGINDYEYFIKGQQVRVWKMICEYVLRNGWAMSKADIERMSKRIVIAEFEGGRVLSCIVGPHKDVIILDFASLYPSIIMGCGIDYASMVWCQRQRMMADHHKHAIFRVRVNDTQFTEWAQGCKTILPALEDVLVGARKKAKKLEEEQEDLCTQAKANGDKDKYEKHSILRGVYNAMQLAIKVTCNAAYGFLGVGGDEDETSDGEANMMDPKAGLVDKSKADKHGPMSDGVGREDGVSIQTFKDPNTGLYRTKRVDVYKEHGLRPSGSRNYIDENGFLVTGRRGGGPNGAKKKPTKRRKFKQTKYLPCRPMAVTITAQGRTMLGQVMELVESFGGRVVYGDTDSVMFTIPPDPIVMDIMDHLPPEDTMTRKYLWRKMRVDQGEFIASKATGLFKDRKAIKLEMEKVGEKYVILGKKTYFCEIYTAPNDTKCMTRGLFVIRRDWPKSTRDTGWRVLRQVIHHDKKVKDLRHVIFRHQIRDEKLPLADYTVSKKVGAKYADGVMPPQLYVANMMRRECPNDAPEPDDYVHYIFTDQPGEKVALKAVYPDKFKKDPTLRVDKTYYKKQLRTPIERIFMALDPEATKSLMAKAEAFGNANNALRFDSPPSCITSSTSATMPTPTVQKVTFKPNVSSLQQNQPQQGGNQVRQNRLFFQPAPQRRR